MRSVKTHYDEIYQNIGTEEQRFNGDAYPLKKFHNQIKSDLIRIFSNRIKSNNRLLLDLGVGRGGDIHKWIYSNITYAKGIDIADVTEACRRYNEAKSLPKYIGRNFTAEFMQWSGLGTDCLPKDPYMPYDIVTSMFMSQYLFITKNSAINFFKNVSMALKDGGYFIGCVPDGNMICNLLKDDSCFNSDMLCIKKQWLGNPQQFGSAYTFTLKDTVTSNSKSNQTQDNESPNEYLVNLKVFEELAANNNLYPIKNYPPNINHNFNNEDKNSTFKHFWPNLQNKYLNMASEIYVAFVFKKCVPKQTTNKRKYDTAFG
jgi:mRNA (guanine-N7-)-methyltransferase